MSETPTQEWAKVVRSGKRVPSPPDPLATPDYTKGPEPITGKPDIVQPGKPPWEQVVPGPILEDPEHKFIPPTPEQLGSTYPVSPIYTGTTSPLPTVKTIGESEKVPLWMWVTIIVLFLLVIYLYFAKVNPEQNPFSVSAVTSTVLGGICQSKVELMQDTLDQFYQKPRAAGELSRKIKVQWTGVCPKTVWQSNFGNDTVIDEISFSQR